MQEPSFPSESHFHSIATNQQETIFRKKKVIERSEGLHTIVKSQKAITAYFLDEQLGSSFT